MLGTGDYGTRPRWHLAKGASDRSFQDSAGSPREAERGSTWCQVQGMLAQLRGPFATSEDMPWLLRCRYYAGAPWHWV